jgi:uncharacterized protein
MPGAPVYSEAELAGLCRRWKVLRLSVFGSAARGTLGPGSDVDVLVGFAPDAPWSAFDLIDLRDELGRVFGRRVDLVEEGAPRNPYFLASIERDRRVLYAA